MENGTFVKETPVEDSNVNAFSNYLKSKTNTL